MLAGGTKAGGFTDQQDIVHYSVASRLCVENITYFSSLFYDCCSNTGLIFYNQNN